MRPIEYLTLAVFLTLGLLLLAFHQELAWAAAELPRQLSGEISTPRDRLLTLEALELMQDETNLQKAEKLLQQSLAVEPNSEALLYLAICRLHLGKLEQAEPDFERARVFDPDRREVYLGLAEVQRRRGRPLRAEQTLRAGIDHFEACYPRYRPQVAAGADDRASEKARTTYRYYRNSIIALKRAL